MHAYRDALGAETGGILYPGTEYEVPRAHEAASGRPTLQGIGAAAVRPRAGH